MQSFTSLNTPDIVEFEDLRLPNIKTDVPRAFDTDFTETVGEFPVYREIDVVEIIRPELVNLRYKIEVTTQVVGAIPEVVWSPTPSGVTIFASNNTYIVSGIDTLAKWNAVKNPVIRINDFLGNFSYSVSIIYFNGTADEEIRWTVGTYVPAALMPAEFSLISSAERTSLASAALQSQFTLELEPETGLNSFFTMTTTAGIVKPMASTMSAQTAITVNAVKFIDFATVSTFSPVGSSNVGRRIVSTPLSQLSALQSPNVITNWATYSGGTNSSGIINVTTGFFGRNTNPQFPFPNSTDCARSGPRGAIVYGSSYYKYFENVGPSAGTQPPTTTVVGHPTGSQFDKITINPSQTKIAVSTVNSGRIDVFEDTSDNTLLFTITGPTQGYRSLHMDDDVIVGATYNAGVHVFSAVDGTLVKVITPAHGGVTTMSYRLNEICLSFDFNNDTQIINLTTENQIALLPFKSLYVAHTELYYAFGTDDGVKIYDRSTLNLLRTIYGPTGSGTWGRSVAIEEEFLLVGEPFRNSNAGEIYLYK